MSKELNYYGPGVVYFIKVNGLIKIGFTECLKRRMYAYNFYASTPVELLHFEPGDKDREKMYHRLFKRHLTKGKEWFRCDEGMLRFIRTAAERHVKLREGYGLVSD